MAFSPSTPSVLTTTSTGHHPPVRHGGAVLPNTSLFPSVGGGCGTSGAWNPEDVEVTSTAQRETALSRSAAPVVSAGAKALAGCLSGGLFAGGLHAIAGKLARTHN